MDVTFNNDYVDPNFANAAIDNIVSTEMTGKVVRLLEGDQICLFVTRTANVGGGSVPTMIVGQTSLSIVELAGGNDGPSGPQGPTGPQAPIAPASAIRVSLDINASKNL